MQTTKLVLTSEDVAGSNLHACPTPATVDAPPGCSDYHLRTWRLAQNCERDLQITRMSSSGCVVNDLVQLGAADFMGIVALAHFVGKHEKVWLRGYARAVSSELRGNKVDGPTPFASVVGLAPAGVQSAILEEIIEGEHDDVQPWCAALMLLQCPGNACCKQPSARSV